MADAVVTISLPDIFWFFGFITAGIGVWVALKKIPFFSHEKRIQHLEEIAEENAELSKLLCRGIKCLLTNARTGNCIDKIQKAEDEIEKYLINK